MRKSALNANLDAGNHGHREYFPEDAAQKLENHILGESFHMKDTDIDKVQQQAEELNNLKQ